MTELREFSLPDMCRESAIECEEVAYRTNDSGVRARVFATAKYWRELADTIENYRRHLPAGMVHYAFAETESEVQVSGMGPFDVTYIDPKDDPLKT
jgi:hypothetical protein